MSDSPKSPRKRKKPKADDLCSPPPENLPPRALACYGNIKPDEVAAATSPSPEPLPDPSAIRRDVLAAIARKIHPERIAGCIDEMLDAKRMTNTGALVPDYRAREAGMKMYCLLMDIVKPPAGEDDPGQADAAEAHLLHRLQESSTAQSLLAAALERANMQRQNQPTTIDAEIVTTTTTTDTTNERTTTNDPPTDSRKRTGGNRKQR